MTNDQAKHLRGPEITRVWFDETHNFAPGELEGVVMPDEDLPWTAGRLMAELAKLPPETLMHGNDSTWGPEPMQGMRYDPELGTAEVWQ